MSFLFPMIEGELCRVVVGYFFSGKDDAFFAVGLMESRDCLNIVLSEFFWKAGALTLSFVSCLEFRSHLLLLSEFSGP